MKILSAKVHGIIDYVVVIFLWLSPTLFGLTSPISTLVYALGGVHLLLTILTDFPYGAIKVIPLRLHGWVELLVAIVLMLSPLYLPLFVSSGSAMDLYFLAGFGGAVLLTWVVTDYSGTVA